DIAQAIDIIVQLVVIDGKHRVSHITEIIPVLGDTDEAKITANDIYLWDRPTDTFYKAANMSDTLRETLDERNVKHRMFQQSPTGDYVKHHNFELNQARDFGSSATVSALRKTPDEAKVSREIGAKGVEKVAPEGAKKKRGLPINRGRRI